VGTALSPPRAEGGALRSQSVRRADGPATLNGAVLRIAPATGAGVPGNPFYSSSDPNARRIVAYGLRNPFRFTQRPGTNELWIGDVGWNTWEEINRVVTGQCDRVELRLAVL
jgi:glucose/arabinose dehydrogenase